jgi:hypothetical protein
MRLSALSRPAIGLAIAASTALGIATTTSAQEASPTAAMTGGVPCTAEPRNIDELLAVWFSPEGTPVPATELQPPFNSESELPQGTPADEATTIAITDTIRQVFACFDSNQYTRAFSLMTDHALGLFGPSAENPDEDTPEEVRALLEAQDALTPTPVEAELQTIIDDARDARILDDGRAAAIFASEGDTVFAYFVQTGDQWLLDDFVDIAESGTPQAG